MPRQKEAKQNLEQPVKNVVQSDQDPMPKEVFRKWHANDMQDKGLFIIVAFVGFSLIISLKLFTALLSHWIAVLAVITMFSYLIIALRIPELVLRIDRLGDNFYYLGFIFTLASLSAAMIEIQYDQSVVKSILGSFGIALMTTIFGIAGRIALVQMRGEFEEIEDETRRSLVERSETLKEEIGSLITDFSTLRTALVQISGEFSEVTPKAIDTKFDLLLNATEGAAKRFDSCFSSQLSNLTKIDGAFQRLSEITEETAQKMSSVMELNASTVQEMGEEVVKTIEGAKDKQNELLLKATNTIEKHSERSDQLDSKLQRAVVSDAEILDKVNIITGRLDELSVPKIVEDISDRSKFSMFGNYGNKL